MSATLTWHRTTATKTGTTSAALFTDIKSAVDAQSANADFKWQVSSSSLAGTPFYVTLKPKAGGAGRILIIQWSSSPAANNAAILDTTPSTTTIYICYFPSGNVDTPSNLTAASGTIMGDDTNVVKVTACGSLATIYAASIQPYIWDSDEAVWFQFQNPASTTNYAAGAGKIFVDKDDNEYSGVWGHGTGNFSDIGSASPSIPYSTATISAGGTAAAARAHKGANNRVYFTAYGRLGSWADQAIAGSILYDGTNSKSYFDAVLLIPNIKGVGPDIKLRQLCVGPPTVASFSVFNSASLTPAAISSQANSGSASGNAWFTNFKV